MADTTPRRRGILERLQDRAFTRAQRHLAPAMTPGETVLAVDICRGGKTVDELLQRRGPKVHVVLTDKALYVVERGGDVSSMPLTEITDLAFQEPPAPGDRARIVILKLGERGFVAFLPVGRRAVADFAPKMQQLLQGQPWFEG